MTARQNDSKTKRQQDRKHIERQKDRKTRKMQDDSYEIVHAFQMDYVCEQEFKKKI